jgi:hypothetical protein
MERQVKTASIFPPPFWQPRLPFAAGGGDLK